MDIADENVSLFVCRTLDTLGYSPKMIDMRRAAFNMLKPHYPGCKVIVAGSQIEGIAKPCEAETDIYFIKQNIKCVNMMREGRYNGYTVFQTSDKGVAPGYTRLKIKRYRTGGFFTEDSAVQNALFHKHLANNAYKNTMKSKIKDKNSPVLRMQNTLGTCLKMHTGKAKCLFPLQVAYNKENLYDSFVRQRHYNWPPPELIDEITEMDGYLMPIGSTESEWPFLEWRICYTLAEIRLIHSLNITQIKLYILLKMIAKTTLKPISAAMSSYVMKNVVLWMAERYPSGIFEERNIVLLLLTAFEQLYNFVRGGRVPCYMMPERNLLQGVLDVRTKYEILETLFQLQQEKACVFLRLEKMKCAMLALFATPDLMERYQEDRDRLETLILIKNLIQATYVSRATSVDEYRMLLRDNIDWARVTIAINLMVLTSDDELQPDCKTIDELVKDRLTKIME